MTCLLCMMMSPLHQADVILARVTVHADVTVTWVGSAHPGEEDACDAWPATPPARDGACSRFRRPISTLFSPVASSLPPLHNDMVKTQF
jgi:hypothetical protein